MVRSIKKFVLLVGVCCLFTANTARAQDSETLRVWKEYRGHKRQQVSELCDIWVAKWRPGTVAKTYVELANRYAEIQTRACHPLLRSHVGQAERACTEIAELMSSRSNISDILDIVQGVTGNPGNDAPRDAQRIAELLRQIRETEDALAKQLDLD